MKKKMLLSFWHIVKKGVLNLRAPFFALVMASLLSTIVLLINGNNPFFYFTKLVEYAFYRSDLNIFSDTMLIWFIYGIGGMAVMASFRAGLFNIGVAGQMIAAGFVTILIGQIVMSPVLMILFAFFIGSIVSGLLALIIVWLRKKFNVHEVVSSILFNWAIWYFVKWLVIISGIYDFSNAMTYDMRKEMNFVVNGNAFLIPALIMIGLMLFLLIVFNHSVFSFRLGAVKLNEKAAQYAGINKDFLRMISFVISGSIAGIMGVIYYISRSRHLVFLRDSLPVEGFDVIAVALLGQNNIFGIFVSSFLISVIRSGSLVGEGLSNPVTPSISQLIVGIIIYVSAFGLYAQNKGWWRRNFLQKFCVFLLRKWRNKKK